MCVYEAVLHSKPMCFYLSTTPTYARGSIDDGDGTNNVVFALTQPRAAIVPRHLMHTVRHTRIACIQTSSLDQLCYDQLHRVGPLYAVEAALR